MDHRDDLPLCGGLELASIQMRLDRVEEIVSTFEVATLPITIEVKAHRLVVFAMLTGLALGVGAVAVGVLVASLLRHG